MGGTAVTTAGGVPVPTKSLKDQRSDLIAAFTTTLDACIAQADNAAETRVPPAKARMELTLTFPKGEINKNIGFDLVQDIGPQVTRQVQSAATSSTSTSASSSATA